MYRLIITDLSEHVSSPIIIDNYIEIINIFNNVIFLIINRRYYDDDLPSITLEIDNVKYNYYYKSKDNWLSIVKEDKSDKVFANLQKSWIELLNDWINLLTQHGIVYQWRFKHINKIYLEELETLFGRTMYINRLDNEISLIITKI